MDDLLRTGSVALGGLAVALMLFCFAAMQVVVRRLSPTAAQFSGIVLLILGLAALLAAAHAASIAIVLAATVLAGLGEGLAFGGSLADVNAAAPADLRANVVSGYYVIVYLGTSVPTAGVGILALRTGLLPAVQVFAYATRGRVPGAAARAGSRQEVAPWTARRSPLTNSSC